MEYKLFQEINLKKTNTSIKILFYQTLHVRVLHAYVFWAATKNDYYKITLRLKIMQTILFVTKMYLLNGLKLPQIMPKQNKLLKRQCNDHSRIQITKIVFR